MCGDDNMRPKRRSKFSLKPVDEYFSFLDTLQIKVMNTKQKSHTSVFRIFPKKQQS